MRKGAGQGILGRKKCQDQREQKGKSTVKLVSRRRLIGKIICFDDRSTLTFKNREVCHLVPFSAEGRKYGKGRHYSITAIRTFSIT